MVSPLWKACSDGDIQKVHELLNEPSAVDIELKGAHHQLSSSALRSPARWKITLTRDLDHTGATPLIEAVRNGHVEVVKYLLEKGSSSVA